MAAAKLVVITMLCFCVCAHAQTRPLAVYPGHAEGLDSTTTHSLDQELKRLLSPAGVDITWRANGEGSREQEGRMVVGTFAGKCSVETIAIRRASPSDIRTLAETSISNGRILPYFTVDCDHVIRTLAPMLEPLSPPLRQSVLGRALARVIAHEIYHILAETTDHADTGVAKAQMNFRDLTTDHFDLSPTSLQRIRAAYRPGPAAAAPIAGLMTPGSPKR
jgi:hypothetical protein